MRIPDIASLRIDDATSAGFAAISNNVFPADSEDHALYKLKVYAKSLPYSIEPESQMMEMLNFIVLRLVQCIEAKDFDVGMVQWDSMLHYWTTLKYPIPKSMRLKLAKLYYRMCITPGLSSSRIATCADLFKLLVGSKKKTNIEDLRLPWKPVYDILHQDLFLSRRQFEYTQLTWLMGFVAENARQFYHPAAIGEMLSTFVPQINANLLDSILAAEYYLLTFLPLSHPQSYLPMLFRMWESVNSYMYDERMLNFLSKLAEMHVDPSVSDPRRVKDIPDDEVSGNEGRPSFAQEDLGEGFPWTGLFKDVGIFTDHQWNLIMCKCLASMEIPLADAGSLSTAPQADTQAGFEITRLPKTSWRIVSLARIIVYSMAQDGMPAPTSNMPSPAMTPLPSGMNTPQPSSSLNDYLSAPLGKRLLADKKTYLAGSKALDSLARLIASTESFFHPSNAGSWTGDVRTLGPPRAEVVHAEGVIPYHDADVDILQLSAFIKYIVYDFNKRWHEEQQPDCKTPPHRRLTRSMKRELVKCLRTVTLLAMFSEDSATVSNIQSCLKSMSVMEPDLILHPILERAIPSLESLVETQRTIAVIKALGAVASAIVSRDIYYPGAKHLVPILELLIPGIDLNDPSKTLCTTAFLVEISQCIKFGDLTTGDETMPTLWDGDATFPSKEDITLPKFDVDVMFEEHLDVHPRLSDSEEDVLLKDTTTSFADWVTNFIRRVIQLMENLPEETFGNSSSSRGTEVQVVDSVVGACSQICVHLSETLYDMVLNMVYDYATTNVRSNAVRAIHQLVECVANADPDKTLGKFLPFCSQTIRTELENGAGSTRSTSVSSPIPSDTTLHWNLAILRGSVYNDGRAIVKYKAELLSLLKLLHQKVRSKRAFSWTGKLLSSMLLTLTHTYPLENKFVNPDEWGSEEFKWAHHLSWGKLYKPEDVVIAWHVPNEEEIDMAVEIFQTLIQPTLETLESLLKPGVTKDDVWRNDFCRHLSLVRNAFAGIPTLLQHPVNVEERVASADSSDILDEIPEMIAIIMPINGGFCLTDQSDHRYRYMISLRERFGYFLHNASVSLLQHGEENTLDAVHLLVRSIRTFMLDYGDSKDSYFVNEESYESEKNVARLYAKQKVWPRAVLVRRARRYQSTRLRWISLDRYKGKLEDNLVDDLMEWSMWHYVLIRESSQSVLDAINSCYDGVRRRCFPKIYRALKPGSENDRMKGALWTLNLSTFGKHAVSEPVLAEDLMIALLECQHNEKSSIQDCVSTVADNCLSNFVEPCYLVYNANTDILDKLAMSLKPSDLWNDSEAAVTERCRGQRIRRVEKMNLAMDRLTSKIMQIGNSVDLHWKYAILAIRCLRTLVRRDIPLTAPQVQYLLDKTHDIHPTVRYYAQRAVMKSFRNIKLRTYCASPEDLYLGRSRNPLKQAIQVERSNDFNSKYFQGFRRHCDLSRLAPEPIFLDKELSGLAAWGNTITLFKPPSMHQSTFHWESASEDAIAKLRDVTCQPEYWKKLILHFSEENHETSITQDNVSVVKSIFHILMDEPLHAVKAALVDLINNKEKDNQRASAELLAGLLGASKHWPLARQIALWKWFEPFMKQIFSQNLKTDTLRVWTSFLEYMFYNRDPRRVQPLVDYLTSSFFNLDFNAELSFDSVKVLSLFRAFYEELGLKFTPWADDAVQKCWKELHSDHEDVRAYIAELLAFTSRIGVQPEPSQPSLEAFMKECRTMPLDYDIMGMRGTYHHFRVLELVENFKVWRLERTSGTRASHSKYDRVGVTVCKWLYQSLHDIHAICAFDYIIPLMPEFLRFTELNDNDELAQRAHNLLVRMCGVTPPKPLIHPILDALFEAIQASPSWRVRLKALPLVQVFYFRQMPWISDIKVTEILEVLCKCLDDEIVEVRDMAAATLSGILRISPRKSVLTYKDRFVRLAKNSHIPPRKDPDYNKAIRRRHAAILGICALVDSYPYTVEKWMPDLLTGVLANHTYDPVPISTAVRKCASNFKKTHQDTWHEDKNRFNDEQLSALSALLTGSSYYA